MKKKGVMVDPEKVKVVTELLRPTSVSEIQSFLGLLGYYKHFVKEFSKIAAPMTRLLQKSVKFSLSDKCE